MFKDLILEFIDELMSLFSEKNRIIYGHLILFHHKVKNTYTDDEIIAFTLGNTNPMIERKIKDRDVSFLNSTPMQLESDWIWFELTDENKQIVWKWIDVIMDRILSYHE